MSDVKVAKALGWASFAIGFAEIACTQWVQEMLGVDGHETLLRTMGARECAAGAMIVPERDATPQLAAGLWARVAGDAIDVALLGAAARKTRNPTGLAVATTMVLGITALDVMYAVKLSKEQDPTATSSGVRMARRVREMVHA